MKSIKKIFFFILFTLLFVYILNLNGISHSVQENIQKTTPRISILNQSLKNHLVTELPQDKSISHISNRYSRLLQFIQDESKKRVNHYCKKKSAPFDNPEVSKMITENRERIKDLDSKCNNLTEIPEIVEERIFPRHPKKPVFKICLNNIFLGNITRQIGSNCSAVSFNKQLNEDETNNLIFSDELSYFKLVNGYQCIHLINGKITVIACFGWSII